MPTSVHHGFQNCWVFCDTHSAWWTHAKDVFLTPHPGWCQSEYDVGVALGYPIRGSGFKNQGTVYYIDAVESQELSRAAGEDVGHVIVFEYGTPTDAQGKDEEIIDVQYNIGVKIVKSVGRDLVFQFC